MYFTQDSILSIVGLSASKTFPSARLILKMAFIFLPSSIGSWLERLFLSVMSSSSSIRRSFSSMPGIICSCARPCSFSAVLSEEPKALATTFGSAMIRSLTLAIPILFRSSVLFGPIPLTSSTLLLLLSIALGAISEASISSIFFLMSSISPFCFVMAVAVFASLDSSFVKVSLTSFSWAFTLSAMVVSMFFISFVWSLSCFLKSAMFSSTRNILPCSASISFC